MTEPQKSNSDTYFNYDSVMLEFQDRQNRSLNLLLYNAFKDDKDIENYLKLTKNILSKISVDTVFFSKNDKIIGKKNEVKNKIILIRMKSKADVVNVLKIWRLIDKP